MILSEFLTQILAIENDPSKGVFSDAQNTAALRSALARYDTIRPYRSSSLFDGNGTTLITLTGLTAMNIRKVWWLQDDDADNIELPFYAYQQAGTWYLDTKEIAVPTGTNNIMLVTEIVHSIDDLDAAASTTIPSGDQYLLCQAAAGYAMLSMAVSNIENNNLNRDESRRYTELGTLLLELFDRQLGAYDSGLQSASWHDGSTVDRAF